MNTNRTVTSREYKLMLRTDRFHDCSAGTTAFWSLVKFLVEQGSGIPVFKEQTEVLRRVTWYLDTPEHELYQHGFILRIRQEENDGKPFTVTLKYRDADRYIAAGQDLRCQKKVKPEDDKFEEDILPPFCSKFAHSMSFKAKQLPELDTINQVTKIFPRLVGLPIASDKRIEIVHGFRAQEVAHRIGQFDFLQSSNTLPNEPDFVTKCCLTFWYLVGKETEWPLTVEFSFDYDLPEAQRKQNDQLEHFAPAVVAGSKRLFESLQKQEDWLDLSGTTKTASAYERL